MNLVAMQVSGAEGPMMEQGGAFGWICSPSRVCYYGLPRIFSHFEICAIIHPKKFGLPPQF